VTLTVTVALVSSWLAAALAAEALPTRAFGRSPARRRQLLAGLGLPLLAGVQLSAMAPLLGLSASIAVLLCAWMLVGWIHTLLLDRWPQQLRRLGFVIGGGTALSAMLSMLWLAR
jgi:hypothetical protein